jgi:hypothetical protein
MAAAYPNPTTLPHPQGNQPSACSPLPPAFAPALPPAVAPAPAPAAAPSVREQNVAPDTGLLARFARTTRRLKDLTPRGTVLPRADNGTAELCLSYSLRGECHSNCSRCTTAHRQFTPSHQSASRQRFLDPGRCQVTATAAAGRYAGLDAAPIHPFGIPTSKSIGGDRKGTQC